MIVGLAAASIARTRPRRCLRSGAGRVARPPSRESAGRHHRDRGLRRPATRARGRDPSWSMAVSHLQVGVPVGRRASQRGQGTPDRNAPRTPSDGLWVIVAARHDHGRSGACGRTTGGGRRVTIGHERLREEQRPVVHRDLPRPLGDTPMMRAGARRSVAGVRRLRYRPGSPARVASRAGTGCHRRQPGERQPTVRGGGRHLRATSGRLGSPAYPVTTRRSRGASLRTIAPSSPQTTMSSMRAP